MFDRRLHRFAHQMSIHTRIVLGTLSFFNALILIALGAGSVFYVNRVAGPFLGGCLGFLAGVLMSLSRWLRKGTEWN